MAVQAPIWLAGNSGSMDADTAVAVLGVLKIVLGWPLQLAALGAMVWVLARNHTPIAKPDGLRVRQPPWVCGESRRSSSSSTSDGTTNSSSSPASSGCSPLGV